MEDFDFDQLSDEDRAVFSKLLRTDLILGALISLQYGALAGLAMATCFLLKLELGLSMFSGIVLCSSTLIYLWSVGQAHMKARRITLIEKVTAHIDLIENRK